MVVMETYRLALRTPAEQHIRRERPHPISARRTGAASGRHMYATTSLWGIAERVLPPVAVNGLHDGFDMPTRAPLTRSPSKPVMLLINS
jgi:hypothetical protein